MIDVALDTSTPMQSLAFGRDGTLLEERTYEQRQHSRGLARGIRDGLARHGATLGDVDRYIIGLGPGSFTGLRVGLSLIKGLCAGTGASAIGVTSLRATPAVAPPGQRCAVAWDAYKHLVYAAVFETGPTGTAIVDVQVCAPEVFAATLAELDGPLLASGNGFAKYADAFAGVAGRLQAWPENEPSAEGLLRHAWAAELKPVPPATLEPRYLRRSAAEEAREARERAGASPPATAQPPSS